MRQSDAPRKAGEVLISTECLNGLPLTDCPHVVLGDIEIMSDDELEHDLTDLLKTEEASGKVEDEYLNIFTAEALDSNACQPILSSSITRVIILAGQVNSGKTTLLASLFQLFQDKASFAGFRFAGSRTLVGFERRSHPSRIRSGLDSPETQRTVRGGHEYLHLKLGHAGALTDLLFTDISGEYYKELSNSTDECKKFTLARRADHFVLFMDADQLSNPAQRHRTKVEGMAILRSLIEAKMLSKDTYIQIVFSRWDLLLSKENVDEHKEFVLAIKDEIINKYRTLHPHITFFEVASRPKRGSELSFGFGLDVILPAWVRKSQFANSEAFKNYQSKPVITTDRQFAKFRFINN